VAVLIFPHGVEALGPKESTVVLVCGP